MLEGAVLPLMRGVHGTTAPPVAQRMQPMTRVWKPLTKKPRRRFLRSERGSVAIEFALTAIPFFALMFAIFEAGMVFFVNAELDNALNDAGRLIRTGQAQTANMTAEQLLQRVCDDVVMVTNCTENVKIDVRTYTSFGNVTFPSPVDANGNLTNSFQFNMGNAGDIVLVRIFYVWDIMSPLPTGLSGGNGSSRLIQSSVAFRNEPYTS